MNSTMDAVDISSINEIFIACSVCGMFIAGNSIHYCYDNVDWLLASNSTNDLNHREPLTDNNCNKVNNTTQSIDVLEQQSPLLSTWEEVQWQYELVYQKLQQEENQPISQDQQLEEQQLQLQEQQPQDHEWCLPQKQQAKLQQSGRHKKSTILQQEFEKKEKCNICHKAFTKMAYLKQHFNVKHLGERSFKCKICGKYFATEDIWMKHTSSHTGKKRYQCGECDRKYMYRSDLKRHQFKHTGMKPYTCPKCNKHFIRKDHFKNHEKSHLRRERET